MYNNKTKREKREIPEEKLQKIIRYIKDNKYGKITITLKGFDRPFDITTENRDRVYPDDNYSPDWRED